MDRLIRLIMVLLIAASAAGFVYAAEPLAEVTSLEGSVMILPSGEALEVKCEKGMLLKSGDRITTGEKSYLEIAFDSEKGNVVKVKENTQVVVRLKGDEKIELIDGELVTSLKNLKKGTEFRIVTPSAVCGARGTGWVTKAGKDLTVISVFDGTVFTLGLEKDGSLMEKEYLTKYGYRREIKRFETPGGLEKISEIDLKDMRKEIKVPPQFKRRKISKYMLERKFAAISDKVDRIALAEAKIDMMDKINITTDARLFVQDVQPIKMDRVNMDMKPMMNKMNTNPASTTSDRERRISTQ